LGHFQLRDLDMGGEEASDLSGALCRRCSTSGMIDRFAAA
jgi:hypothetical protein